MPCVSEKSPFLYLFICKHADVGGGLLTKGIFPICQDGAVEESQVFAFRVMKLELGKNQTGSPTRAAVGQSAARAAQLPQGTRGRGHGHSAGFPPLLLQQQRQQQQENKLLLMPL